MTSPVLDAALKAGILRRVDDLRKELDGLASEFERIKQACMEKVQAVENHIVGATRRLRTLKAYLEGHEEDLGG